MDVSQLKKLLFPHDKIREIQSDLIKDTDNCIEKKSHLIAHAPTGLGKTAATLAPALAKALEKEGMTVFFLTSRHTQHRIALDTLASIKKKHNADFSAVSIIGKKWMCSLPETSSLFQKDFTSYCKALREDDKCEFYSNTGSRQKPSFECRRAIEKIKAFSPADTSRIIAVCKKEKLCPYEVSLMLAADSKVIIADYFYIVDPFIREIFLKKIGKELNNSIIIFDEAHNLPARIRDLMTAKLSNFVLRRSVEEAHKYRLGDAESYLKGILREFLSLASGLKMDGEALLSSDDFINAVEKKGDYDAILSALEFAADEVREKERSSYIGSVALFLELWKGSDEGYARIISRENGKYGEKTTIAYRCLDPSIYTKDLIQSSYSTVLMSGTLTPTSMYRDLLGFPDNTDEKSYRSPFPHENRLAMIVPKTTTKFTKRTESQFRDIAEISCRIIEKIPGNTAVFFPSYSIMEKVKSYMECSRKMFEEKPGMQKDERAVLLDEFKSCKDAVLLGAASGSFGEGVDIKGNILKGVIVAGLPLDKPTLETRKLIEYYDSKFGKGWDYGYIMPAVTRALQNAGRCIRSETDKGAAIFLDERYSHPNYIKCFPDEWQLKVSVDYENAVKEFFES